MAAAALQPEWGVCINIPPLQIGLLRRSTTPLSVEQIAAVCAGCGQVVQVVGCSETTPCLQGCFESPAE